MATQPTRVLVTNAEERSVLATCRCLHAAGYEVGAGAFGPLAPSHASGSCDERLQMADPLQDSERFVEDLRRQLVRRRYAVLLPGSDRALLAISRGRERLEGLARIGLPAPAGVEGSLDREVMAETAAAVGLSAPQSIRCTGLAEARTAARTLGFPVILKSVRIVDQFGPAIHQTRPSLRIATEDELAEKVVGHDGAFLVQRAESGPTLSVGGVTAGGRLLGVAMARYRRTWPVQAGNVAFSETIAPPPQLEEMVGALVAGIGWEGIFELELIEAASDRFVAIDFNPRPYGSLALAVAAGAPLPAIWCDWLLGRDPQPARARPGYRYRWEDADLRHLIWQLRSGNLRAAAEVARPRRRVAHAYFQITDPLPLLLRGLGMARGHTGRQTPTIDPAPAAPKSNGEPPAT